ncbi:MAG: glycosyltransferase, partial [Thermoanaerobaculia bacterium]
RDAMSDRPVTDSALSVVVATPDVVGERMAGPGIRALYLTRELARHTPATLIAKLEDFRDDGLRAIDRDSPAAEEALASADVLIGQPARGFRRRHRRQRLVLDLFDPLVLELRELYGNTPSIRQRVHLAAEWSRLTYALRRGDLLIAAAPQQRRFYDQLRSSDAPWIEVPFGVDLSEVKPCKPAHDNLVIWGGGLWEWLDPGTAVEAVVSVNARGLRCNLLFLGGSRPNRNVVDPRTEDLLAQLVRAGSPFVSANSEWVPYRERLSWLRSGKIAIMLHRPTEEAEYAIRTRLFDAIAAAVPVIATERGFAAELVRAEQLGLVVPAGDVEAVAAAIERLMTDDAFHATCVQNLERIRPRFAWSVVTRPLVDAVMQWQT